MSLDACISHSLAQDSLSAGTVDSSEGTPDASVSFHHVLEYPCALHNMWGGPWEDGLCLPLQDEVTPDIQHIVECVEEQALRYHRSVGVGLCPI